MAKARNGQGSVRPRTLADGTVVYDAQASVKDPVTGRTSRVSKRGLPSETAAVEWIQEKRTSKTRPSKGLTLDNLADLYWSAETIKTSTLSYWKGWYKQDIKPYLGTMDVKDILPMHIDQWVLKIKAVKYRGELRAPTTLVNRVSVLSAILEYGVSNRLIDADWTDSSGGVRKLRTEATNFRADKKANPKERWTPAQFIEFLKMESEPSYRALWCFYAATGVRRGTAIGLRWSDIEWERKRIVASANITATPEGDIEGTQKGGRKIVIHMDDLLEEILRKQWDRQEKAKAEGPWEETDVVFDRPILKKSHKGRVFVAGIPMRPQSVTKRFSQLAEEAKLPPASPHDLRHMWGTMARDLGASRDTVADVLGHRSSVVTEIYDHSETEQKAIAGAMAKLILKEI